MLSVFRKSSEMRGVKLSINGLPTDVSKITLLFVALCFFPSCKQKQEGKLQSEHAAKVQAENSESQKAILRELRKLNAAANTGTSIAAYGDLLVAAVVEVESRLPELPDGLFKDNVKASLKAFKDAKIFWVTCNERFAMTAREGLDMAILLDHEKAQFADYPLGWLNTSEEVDLKGGCLSPAFFKANLSIIWEKGAHSLKLAEAAAR